MVMDEYVPLADGLADITAPVASKISFIRDDASVELGTMNLYV
jgi:hypothetical protein